jgi:hypothetical protein
MNDPRWTAYCFNMPAGDASLSERVAASVAATGDFALANPQYPEDWAEAIASAPRVANRIASSLSLSSRPKSVAIVDWTSLDHACHLLEGTLEDHDPFVALGDLASVAGAAIFYDRVAVLDQGDVVARAQELFGARTIRGLSPGSASGGYKEPARRTAEYLDELYRLAVRDLDIATRRGHDWIDRLRGYWRDVLPSTPFPSHRSRTFGGLGVRYKGSSRSDEESTSSYDRSGVFHPVDGAWRARSDRDLAQLIADNDVRALFYERLAQGVEVMLSPGASKGPSVRYVGGCLRSPLLLARSDTHVVAPAAEEGLQRLWASIPQQEVVADEFPFWMDAILWRARDGGPKEVRAAIREFRQEAKAFRGRRASLESHLRAGDPDASSELLQLLKGELPRFGPLGHLTRAGRTAAKVVLPQLATEVLEGLASLGGTALQRASTRLFRPHLWFVYRVGDAAAHAQRSFDVASRVFSLPPYEVSHPRPFIERLGRVAWIA